MENKRVQPPAATPQSAQVLGVVNMGLVEIQRQAKAS
jgi:hypothetical protein